MIKEVSWWSSGSKEPYFKALEEGFQKWASVVRPRFGHNDAFDDKCYVVIYTDDTDQGQVQSIFKELFSE